MADSNQTVPAAFKLVKVKKPDGTIVTVRRPIQATDTPATKSSNTTSNGTKHSNKSATATTAIPDSTIPSSLPAAAKIPISTEQKKNNIPISTEQKKTNITPASKSPVASPVQPAEKTPVTSTSVHVSAAAATGFRLFGIFRGLGLHRHAATAISNLHPDLGHHDFGDSDGDHGDHGSFEDYEEFDEEFDEEYEDEGDAGGHDDHDHHENEGHDRHTGHSEDHGHEAYQEHDSQDDKTEPKNNSNKSPAITPQVNGLIRQAFVRPFAAQNTNARNANVIKATSKPLPNEKTVQTTTSGNEKISTNAKATIIETTQEMTPPTLGLSPEEKARLAAKDSISWTRYLGWAVTVLFPLLFIALGIMAAWMDGQVLNAPNTTAISQAIVFAVSAWPIVFAGIVAQSLKAAATYKVERGIRLMTLEQLASCQSVAAVVKQPFMLRQFDWLTLGLALLWALSPLTSQALQRMSITGDPKSSNLTIYYSDTTRINEAFDPENIGNPIFTTPISTLFTAAFLPPGPDQKNFTDPYTYPRIPVMDLLVPQSNGWYDASFAKGDPNRYSSYYGIPLQKFDNKTQAGFAGGKYTFTIESSYLQFNCSPLAVDNSTVLEEMGLNITAASSSGTIVMGMGQKFGTGNSTVGIMSDAHGVLSFASAIYPAGSRNHSEGTDEWAYSFCDFTQLFFESQLACTGDVCGVSKIRPNLNRTDFSPMSDFAQRFITATSVDDTQNATTLTERYIYEPASVTDIHDTGTEGFDMSNVTTEAFTQRLAYLVNTYWQLGFATEFQTGNFTLDNKDRIPNLQAEAQYISPARYATDWVWYAIFMTCSVILLVVGVTGMIWEGLTVGPDILGFASTLAKPSRYMRIPPGVNGVLGGAERARVLGEMRVMMQDINADKEVGRIALGTVNANSHRLEKGRLYR